MGPLDLTKRAPRGPREKIDGLLMLARTIDKLRAKLPGGNIGPYKIAGMSEWMLETVGIREEDFLDAVGRAASDEEATAWFHDHANRSAYDKVNRGLSTRTVGDVVDRKRFNAMYPRFASDDAKLLCDVLEEDDRELFRPPA